MNSKVEALAEKHNIKVFYKDGTYRMRLSYIDKDFMNCMILIETKEITEKLINKMVRKNG